MTAIFIIFGLIGFILVYIIIAYNTLVRLRTLTQESWSGIDVFLKKRHDLIPNLVNTVKGYATHERGLLEEVTRYRAQAMGTPDPKRRIEAETALDNTLSKILVSIERYPELKADRNFLILQQELTLIEDRLTSARRYYNGTIREMNLKIQHFPSNIVAGMFGFEQGKFFEIENAKRETPVVQF